MSELQLDHLTHLVGVQAWTTIISLRTEIESFGGPARDRAAALDALSRACWHTASDPFGYAQAIRYAREAARLDDLCGQASRMLGSMLITVGRYEEGAQILRNWHARYHQWEPAVQQRLADVQYNLGYATRYQGLYSQAELWYAAAGQGYAAAGNETWACYVSCALAQVQARMGRSEAARQNLSRVPVGGDYEGYRLKAMTEILAAEGDHEAALVIGEDASEALTDMNDEDPWELAELHVLLAKLQFQAGNLVDRDRHLEVVDVVLRTSPRHDLYTQVRLLLDLDGKEVAV